MSSFYLPISDSGYPFLYSDEQIIQIEDNKEFYDLKFKIIEYNNETLYLNHDYRTNIYLDKCLNDGKYLTCTINKEDIEEVLYYSGQKFEVYSFNKYDELSQIGLILNITVKFDIKKKQDIYVGIGKLLQQYIDKNNYITYETNVTSISNLVSDSFRIPKDKTDIYCYFKKAGNVSLLFLCKLDFNNGDNRIGQINKKIILNNSSLKYNFIIPSINNDEIFRFFYARSTPLFSYPKVFDFNLGDSFKINYLLRAKINDEEMKLIKRFKKLKCSFPYGKSSTYMIMSCDVDRAYFANEKVDIIILIMIHIINIIQLFMNFLQLK